MDDEFQKNPYRDRGDDALEQVEVKAPLTTSGVRIEFKNETTTTVYNGDAAIAGGGNRRFTGLTKAELEKYEKDPFWKRLRMFLLILFWLAWLGILAAAVYIVVTHRTKAPVVKAVGQNYTLYNATSEMYTGVTPPADRIVTPIDNTFVQRDTGVIRDPGVRTSARNLDVDNNSPPARTKRSIDLPKTSWAGPPARVSRAALFDADVPRRGDGFSFKIS